MSQIDEAFKGQSFYWYGNPHFIANGLEAYEFGQNLKIIVPCHEDKKLYAHYGLPLLRTADLLENSDQQDKINIIAFERTRVEPCTNNNTLFNSIVPQTRVGTQH